MSAKAIYETDGKSLVAKCLQNNCYVKNKFAVVVQETNWDDLVKDNPWILSQVRHCFINKFVVLFNCIHSASRGENNWSLDSWILLCIYEFYIFNLEFWALTYLEDHCVKYKEDFCKILSCLYSLFPRNNVIRFAFPFTARSKEIDRIGLYL